MAISDIITFDNVMSYARAGIELARTTERLRQDGYKTLIVPSRGAAPIIRIAQSYYRRVVLPHVPRKDAARYSAHFLSGPLTRSVEIPFTADAGHMSVDDLSTSQIRHFWARVVKFMVRKEHHDPHYRLFRFVRDEVCRVGHHSDLEHLMENERFLFIDTVVSGRAICEIVDAFESEGLNQIHYILILDENGRSMKSDYARRIRELEANGRATLIEVNNLFTEDQGPAVSGIWSVVIPDLMNVAREDSIFDEGIVGAGLYYYEVQNRKDSSNLNVTIAIAQLTTILSTAMLAVADVDAIWRDLEMIDPSYTNEESLERLCDRSSDLSQWLPETIDMYIDHIARNKLFHQNSTRTIATPKILAGTSGNVKVNVSSSHCIRLEIGKSEAVRLMKKFKQSLSRP